MYEYLKKITLRKSWNLIEMKTTYENYKYIKRVVGGINIKWNIKWEYVWSCSEDRRFKEKERKINI